jgi:hypothetical protein
MHLPPEDVILQLYILDVGVHTAYSAWYSVVPYAQQAGTNLTCAWLLAFLYAWSFLHFCFNCTIKCGSRMLACMFSKHATLVTRACFAYKCPTLLSSLPDCADGGISGGEEQAILELVATGKVTPHSHSELSAQSWSQAFSTSSCGC